MIGAADFAELQQVVWLYTHAIDDRRFSRANEVFTEDATVDFSDVGGGICIGLPAIKEFWRKTLSTEVIHLASNIVVDLREDGTVDMLSRALVSTVGGAISNVAYTDIACRTDKGWRIRHRHIAVRVNAPTVPES